MGAIFRAPTLRDPRVVPTEPVEIDWSHPLANGLVALFVPGSPHGLVDLCGNGRLTSGSTGTIVSGPGGVGLQTVNFSDAATAPIYGTKWATAQIIQWRGTMLGGRTGSGGMPWIFGTDNAADTNRTWVIYNNGAGSDYYFFASSYKDFNIPIPSTETTAVSLAVDLAASGCSCYYNGAPTSGSQFVSPGTLASDSLLYLGGVCSAISEQATLYDTQDVSLPWLHAEPFAMLRPQMRRRYYVPSSGSAVTASPGAGSLKIIGAAPTAEIANTVAPGLGTIDLSGVAPAVQIGVTVSPAKDTLAISGDVPVAEVGVTASPPADAITLAGASPTVEIGVDASPGASTLDIAGATPTVAIGVTEAPGAGTIALQGQTPTVSTGTTSLTVSPAHGVLTVDGAAPAVEVGVTVAPAKGALAVVGQSPAAEIGVDLAPGAALLSLDGAVPLVLRGVSISPAHGSVSFAGATPVIVIGGLMIPTEIVVFAAPVDQVAFAVSLDRVQFATPTDTVVF